jgi:hypothetical protein
MCWVLGLASSAGVGLVPTHSFDPSTLIFSTLLPALPWRWASAGGVRQKRMGSIAAQSMAVCAFLNIWTLQYR